jgi:hypothetical protein
MLGELLAELLGVNRISEHMFGNLLLGSLLGADRLCDTEYIEPWLYRCEKVPLPRSIRSQAGRKLIMGTKHSIFFIQQQQPDM